MKIATSQFPVSDSITNNKHFIFSQMRQASEEGAAVIHFPECAISGYAGVDMPDLSKLDWQQLEKATTEIMTLANELNIWVILGSTHRLSNKKKPHNCLYLINNDGQLVDRYDKMFCAGNPEGTEGDLAHYSSGNHFVIVEIEGVKCGLQICHDYRYPELYRELKRKGVAMVFHSFHAARMRGERKQMMQDQVGSEYFKVNPGKTIPEITMPATMISYAANNHVWISASNSSAPDSCWGAFSVRPDGVIYDQLPKNESGILITEITDNQNFYDSTVHWRERAMNGDFHSGERIDDPRSTNHTAL